MPLSELFLPPPATRSSPLPRGDHPTDLSHRHDPRGFHSLQSAMVSLNFCCCTASELRLRSLSGIIFMGFCNSRCSMLEIVSGNGQFHIGMVSRANISGPAPDDISFRRRDWLTTDSPFPSLSTSPDTLRRFQSTTPGGPSHFPISNHGTPLAAWRLHSPPFSTSLLIVHGGSCPPCSVPSQPFPDRPLSPPRC